MNNECKICGERRQDGPWDDGLCGNCAIEACDDCGGTGRGGQNTTDGGEHDDCRTCSGEGVTSQKQTGEGLTVCIADKASPPGGWKPGQVSPRGVVLDFRAAPLRSAAEFLRCCLTGYRSQLLFPATVNPAIRAERYRRLLWAIRFSASERFPQASPKALDCMAVLGLGLLKFLEFGLRARLYLRDAPVRLLKHCRRPFFHAASSRLNPGPRAHPKVSTTASRRNRSLTMQVEAKVIRAVTEVMPDSSGHFVLFNIVAEGAVSHYACPVESVGQFIHRLRGGAQLAQETRAIAPIKGPSISQPLIVDRPAKAVRSGSLVAIRFLTTEGLPVDVAMTPALARQTIERIAGALAMPG